MVARNVQEGPSEAKLATNSTALSAGSAPPSPKGTDLMPFIAIVIAALAVGFEQLIEWKYGPMGIIAFLTLVIGLKARNTLFSGMGALILVMLLAQSG